MSFGFGTAKENVQDSMSATLFNAQDWKAHPCAVVAFVAEWCGNCTKLHPAFAAAGSQMSRSGVDYLQVILSYTDKTKDPSPGDTQALGQKYDIRGYPAILGFVGGRVVKVYDGDRSVQSLVAFGEEVKRYAAP